MFALLSRAASVADNGGPLARPLFGEKRKRRGEMDGEIKRRGRGRRFSRRKERKGEDGTSLGRAKCTPESATMRLINRPSVHTIDNKPYIIFVEKRSQKPMIFISPSFSLSPAEKFVERV